MALSARLAGEQLTVVNTITLPEAKTKHFVKVKDALGLKKALVVAPEEMIEVMLAARNVPGVTIITPEQLNVYDILNHNHLVLVESVVEQVTARLTA